MDVIYNHKLIEQKWQEKWAEDNLYKTGEDKDRPKFFILDMFPYPSGAGLHVGHPKGYIATDIFARMKMMQGFNVLHPMGWDAFGLPAENFAIKNKIHPKISTDKNIETFKAQLKKLGFTYDWEREINTTDPKFYKWTQWAFLQLFKKGLAYESYEPIIWCPSCQTGLSNEDLEGGKCERCGSEVERKPMRQWVLRITAYAERLLQDLDKLPDWEHSIKEMQRNWIGKSEGARVKFKVQSTKYKVASEKGTLLLLHGLDGSSQENWFPWFRREMEVRGYKVLIPDLPNSELPVLEDWLKTLKNIKDQFEGPLTIVGHSLGCPTACAFIDREKVDVEKLILVAPASEHSRTREELMAFDISSEQLDAMDKFKQAKLSFQNINNHAKQIIQVYSKNDPLISLNAQEDYKELKSEIIIFDDKGHFSESTGGITEFPEIVGIIEDGSSEFTGSYRSANASLQDDKETGSYRSANASFQDDKETGFLRRFAPRDDSFIEVFTTRPDTLFGATYFVVAPEHELIKNQESRIKNIDEVRDYIKKAAAKSELERTDLAKDKTGVRLEGIVAINSVNNEELPIYVADYVLSGYGTGAIMAVPAHDERDFEFAKKYELPINEVVAKETGTRVGDEIKKRGGCAIVFDPKEQKYALLKRADGMLAFYSGGANENESLFDCVQRELQEEGGFHNFETVEPLAHAYTNYYNSVKKHRVCGLALCNLVILKDTDRLPLKLEEHERGFETVWVTPDEILENWQKFSYGDGSLDHWRWFLNLGVARLKELWIDKQAYKNNFKKEVFTDEGIAINSGFLDGLKTADAKEKMIVWLEERGLGERAINYKIKDWVFSRQRYWGEPIPLVHCEKCGIVPVLEKDLPLELPDVEHYEPSGTGESPLATIDEWVNTVCPNCGGAAKRETNTMPQWAGSSWYYLRFIDPNNNEALIDKARDKYWSPVDFYVGGAEHATRHLIYARFWHKFLYDIGVLNYDEPFKRLQHVGLIMAEDGRKMSKRWGNVINPDKIVEQHGADAMRVYEMFMGPFSQAVAWSTNGLIGARKFLERIYKLKNLVVDNQANDSLDNLLHKTIKKVGEDIEAFRFNTAVSSLMILLNEAEKIGRMNDGQYKKILLLVAPFAPHLAEELWSALETDDKSIFKQAWPEYDSELMKDKLITLAIQVNGKLRDTIEVDAEISEEEAKQFALNSAKVKKWTDEQEVIKVVYVKGNLVSVVVK